MSSYELVSKNWTHSTAKQSISKQRYNLEANTRISKSFLKGFRMPHLIRTHKSFKTNILEDLKDFYYDSSIVINPFNTRKSRFNVWPHTLHFKPSYDSLYLDSESHLWEVPLTYFDIDGSIF
jgi:hypothetical protein